MSEKKDILYSFYRIRKTIGLLGIFLPLIVFLGYGDLLSSISHYYYTQSSVFFTAILSAFGLLLISYKGYEMDKSSEWLSDNFITTVGGVAALLVVLIPTACKESASTVVEQMCLAGDYPLFGHNNSTKSTIHLLSAGVFLLAMGWMSIFKFTRTVGEPDKARRRKNVVYRVTGYLVWLSIGLLLLRFLFHIEVTEYDVFVLECVAVVSFGISWLIKGEAIKDMIDLRKMIFGQGEAGSKT